jgi:hypothetical protein
LNVSAGYATMSAGRFYRLDRYYYIAYDKIPVDDIVPTVRIEENDEYSISFFDTKQYSIVRNVHHLSFDSVFKMIRIYKTTAEHLDIWYRYEWNRLSITKNGIKTLRKKGIDAIVITFMHKYNDKLHASVTEFKTKLLQNHAYDTRIGCHKK